MADWLITARDNEHWNVRLSDCDEAHANSVLETLKEDTACPNDLEMLCLGPEIEEELVEPELEPEPPPLEIQPKIEPRKRFRFRRSK